MDKFHKKFGSFNEILLIFVIQKCFENKELQVKKKKINIFRNS